jgi:hypothetical protein
MYVRLTRYQLRVDDAERLSTFVNSGKESPAIGMLEGLEGCRGAWVTKLPSNPGATELPVTAVSFWETREQAESVGERVRGPLGPMLAGLGLSVAGPPEVDVAEVEGRML